MSGAPERPLEAAVPRELTLEEAVTVAILLQKNEEFTAAHEVYRRVLEAAPDHPRALHYAGLLAHQQQRNDEALALIERSLALRPNEADWHSNLGIVLQSAARLGEAIDAYRRAIAIDPGHANAHSNLGVLLRASGEPQQAEAAYRTALQLNPAHIDAWTNLGILLNALKRTEEAAACYSKVITLRPKHRDARSCSRWRTARWATSTKQCASSRNGSPRSPTIPSRVTCWRPVPDRACRSVHRTGSFKQPSTALRRALNRSSRSCPTARRR